MNHTLYTGRHNSFLEEDFPSPVRNYLEALRQRMIPKAEGEIATYIPELANVDPNGFGICITMADGTVYQTGDCGTEYTIQSMSKPFTYGQALKLCGPEVVLNRVGVEPTGEAFNSIVLDDENNRPFNPMVNAGAISIANLLLASNSRSEMLSLFSRLAGRTLEVDESVFNSELSTGHRNRAIAYMMLNTGMINNDPEEVLKLYFQQCSINVTCSDMAMMAATLANLGQNPNTKDQIVEPAYVQKILTLMNTCGMYDYAGQWAFEVGVPAKSGVSGGIIAVIPGQAGISIWSPRLDEYGNSVRGVAVCKELSSHFGLNSFNEKARKDTVIRRLYHLGEISSKRIRSIGEKNFLQGHGSSVIIRELQGSLYFASTETVIRSLSEAPAKVHSIIIDFSHVHYIDEAATRILIDSFQDFLNQGSTIRLSGIQPSSSIGLFKDDVTRELSDIMIFSDLDEALEAAENQVLDKYFEHTDRAKFAFSKLELLDGMSSDEYTVLEDLIRIYSYGPEEKIVSEGDHANSFYVIANGLADVVINLGQGQQKRLASLGPGASFGEMALVKSGRRTADVVAVRSTICYVFPCKEVFQVAQTYPNILITLLSNMAADISARLKLANDEIRRLQ